MRNSPSLRDLLLDHLRLAGLMIRWSASRGPRRVSAATKSASVLPIIIARSDLIDLRDAPIGQQEPAVAILDVDGIGRLVDHRLKEVPGPLQLRGGAGSTSA